MFWNISSACEIPPSENQFVLSVSFSGTMRSLVLVKHLIYFVFTLSILSLSAVKMLHNILMDVIVIVCIIIIVIIIIIIFKQLCLTSIMPFSFFESMNIFNKFLCANQ